MTDLARPDFRLAPGRRAGLVRRVLAALSAGGHLRVGMEDVLTISRGVPVDSNAQLVERAVDGLLLTSRRHLRSNNSWMHNSRRLVKGRTRCTLMIHPDDAARVEAAQDTRRRIADGKAPAATASRSPPHNRHLALLGQMRYLLGVSAGAARWATGRATSRSSRPWPASSR